MLLYTIISTLTIKNIANVTFNLIKNVQTWYTTEIFFAFFIFHRQNRNILYKRTKSLKIVSFSIQKIFLKVNKTTGRSIFRRLCRHVIKSDILACNKAGAFCQIKDLERSAFVLRAKSKIWAEHKRSGLPAAVPKNRLLLYFFFD